MTHFAASLTLIQFHLVHLSCGHKFSHSLNIANNIINLQCKIPWCLFDARTRWASLHKTLVFCLLSRSRSHTKLDMCPLLWKLYIHSEWRAQRWCVPSSAAAFLGQFEQCFVDKAMSALHCPQQLLLIASSIDKNEGKKNKCLSCKEWHVSYCLFHSFCLWFWKHWFFSDMHQVPLPAIIAATQNFAPQVLLCCMLDKSTLEGALVPFVPFSNTCQHSGLWSFPIFISWRHLKSPTKWAP